MPLSFLVSRASSILSDNLFFTHIITFLDYNYFENSLYNEYIEKIIQ
ncbi:hypothetical protein GCWU000323_02868 [Leptotrichia hofstadii F0254]|uniref:Uncharacterized protein n=1 Tax=Leptotrichia hofstadii F0254 TaxID=634994 RepID=C9N1Z3_9FUSO|nr:hypothetical protein GCWU000323_02868 [Leptotrichia hofstadii F0254]